MASKRSKWFIQILLLSILSFLVVTPKVIQSGANTLTTTYSMGSERFWNGQSPYQPPLPGTQIFKYSPFFAMTYYPLSALPPTVQALLWTFLNIVFFWAGITAWFPLSKKTSKWIWIAYVGCSMELNGPLLYQQMDGFVIGITLLGLAAYREKKFTLSGALLMVATNLRAFPGIFAFMLLLNRKHAYSLSLLIGFVISGLMPLLAQGSLSFGFHLEWYSLLFNEANRLGAMDIATALSRYGYSETGSILRLFILFTSFTWMGLAVWQQRKTNWESWISVGFAALLLTNPRTESPDFVWVAPTYLFITTCIAKVERTQLKFAFASFLYLAMFLITLSYNDIWPSALWNPYEQVNLSKIGGTFILWVLAFTFLFEDFMKRNYALLLSVLKIEKDAERPA